MALLITDDCTVLFRGIYSVFKKQESMKKQIVNFFFKIFKVRFVSLKTI